MNTVLNTNDNRREMARQETQVVVIGAGPAGTTCAYQLKKAGIDCVLVDHATFPRDKICGGGLTPKAYHLLEELMPNLHYDYQPVKRLKLMIGTKPVCDIAPKEELRVVSRKYFDYALLHQYLQLGGTFVQGSFHQFEKQTDGSLIVTLKSGEQYHCNYLVGADGANSRVRHQLLGDYDGNVLFMEQYVEKQKDYIEGSVSRRYNAGYYYWFPSVEHDVVGYGDKELTPELFRKILKEMGVAETKVKGAYIPTKEVESGMNEVLLIGDAGGFPNKLTYEGLYYAIASGRNASIAIVENKPFREVNHDMFRRKKRERLIANFFYNTRWGIFIVRCCSISPRLVKRIFDAGV